MDGTSGSAISKMETRGMVSGVDKKYDNLTVFVSAPAQTIVDLIRRVGPL